MADQIPNPIRNPISIPNQNLIKKVSFKELTRPAGFYQGIVLDFLTVISAFFLGYFYKLFLEGKYSILFPLIFLVVFIFFSVFELMLIKSLGRRFFVLILKVLALLVPFYDLTTGILGGKFQLLGIVFAVVFFFMMLADFAGREGMRNNLEIRFFKLTRKETGKIITAVMLAAVLLYMPYWNPQNFISKKAFGTFFDWVVVFANNFFPEVNLTSSTGEILKGFAVSQLKNQPIFNMADPIMKEQLISAAVGQLISSFSQQFGIQIGMDQKLSEVMYNLMVSNLSGLQAKFGDKFIIFWAISLFLLIRTVGVVFSWILSLLIYFLYHLFLAFGVIRLVGESAVRETLEFS